MAKPMVIEEFIYGLKDKEYYTYKAYAITSRITSGKSGSNFLAIAFKNLRTAADINALSSLLVVILKPYSSYFSVLDKYNFFKLFALLQ